MHRSTRFATYFAGLVVAASIVSSPAAAQGSPVGKGSWIISGSAGVSSQKADGADGSTTIITLAPSALYFVSPGVAIGGAVTFGYFNSPQSSATTFGVGPAIRYYFGDRTAKTLPFVSAMVSPTWQSTDPKSSSVVNTSSHNLEIEGTIGFTHLLVPHVGITGEAYYDRLSFDSDRGDFHVTQDSYAIGVRFGLTAFVF